MKSATTVGQLLAQERQRRGITQYALAKLSGLTKQGIWSIEIGRSPSFESVRKIARALEVSLDKIANQLPRDAICKVRKPRVRRRKAAA